MTAEKEYKQFTWKLKNAKLTLLIDFKNREIRIPKGVKKSFREILLEDLGLFIAGTVRGSKVIEYPDGETGIIFGDGSSFNDALDHIKIIQEDRE